MARWWGDGSVKVRHLTSVHSTGDNRIVYRECRSLADAGHDIGLIAGREQSDPVAGVPIIGVGLPRNRPDRMTRVVWKVYRAARRERADVYHFHDPEVIWAGLLLKLTGHRVIYDVHEDVPKQIMNKFWIPAWAKRILSTAATLAERVGAAAFDGIVAATPSIAERFPAHKTVVVQNFPSSGSAQSTQSPPESDGPRHAFAYTGGIAAVQGIREIIAMAALLPADLGGGVLAGWFDDDDLEREVRASDGWRGIRYLGRITPTEVLAAIGSARCGVVVDHPISNYLDSYSTKMFEYMACGVPVVCSDFPLWTEVVTDAECGVVVDPLDPSAIAGAVEQLSGDPDMARRLGDNGRKAILDRYNWEAEFAKLDALYRRMA